MSEFPRFRVVRQTEYGPIIERIKDVPQEAEEDEVVKDTEAGFDPSRRTFLFGLGSLGVAAVAGRMVEPKAAMSEPRAQLENSEVTEDVPLDGELERREIAEASMEGDEAVETIEHSESFAKELEGYKAFFGLKKDEVLFLDEEGQPVGQPVKLQEIVGERYHKDGRLLSPGHTYSPGKLNDLGLPIAGVDKEWLAHAREMQQAKYPDRRIARHRDVIGDFNVLSVSEEEPGLAAAIKRGEITDYKGIVEYYANKETIGGGGLSRIEYVQKEVEFNKEVLPEVVATELTKVMPGLCAQESKFNNGLISRSGARGIFQIMPQYWEHHGGQLAEFSSLKRQVDIVGEYFVDLYRQLKAKVGTEQFSELRSRFADEESFQRDLIVPLLVNSYNAGASRVGEGVKQYCERVPLGRMPEGKDLFLAMADYSYRAKSGTYLAGYSTEAREYVSKVYAWAEVLNA